MFDVLGSDWRQQARGMFAEALARFAPDRPVLILTHFDADGLSAAAILARTLRASGRTAEVRVVGKGETPWSDAICAEVAAAAPSGLIVTDLGVRAEPVAEAPTILIDHHRPTGWPDTATAVSGHGLDPEPTSALLAWTCAGVLGDAADLLWLAALGLIGDMAPEGAFPELAQAQARWGKTALRDATALVNAPRRAAAPPRRTPVPRSTCC